MTSPSGTTVPSHDIARRGAAVAAVALSAPAAALADGCAALGAAAVGLPAGRAASAARALAGRWELAATLWAADMLSHGEALGVAAADYAEGDDAVAGTFPPPVGP